MRRWHVLVSRLRSLFFPSRREADLDEELRLHLDREIERLRANGLSHEAARTRALRTFGGVEQIKEVCRDARGTGLVDAIARDTRHAARRLAHDWRFTLAAVLILAVGIGANTAIFSLVDAALFRRQPAAAPDRLVDIYQNGSNPNGIDGNSYPAYLDMAAYTGVFAATTTALVPRGVNYLEDGVLKPAVVEHTTATYLQVLGLAPALGRWFDAADDTRGAPVVAVIGYDAWQRKFHADPSVVGRTIRIDSVPVTIVGVGPKGHRATIDLGIVTDFWLPIASLPSFGFASTLDRHPAEAAFFVKARLRPGVTVPQAQAAMTSLGARLAAEYPTEDPGRGISVFASSDVRVHPQMDGLLDASAVVLLAVVALVLAIACSNLATLLLVRGTARAREVAVRLALGASRRQLVRHLVIESLLLALTGCAAGCLAAWWAVRWLGTLDLPVIIDLSLDARVLLFAIVISLVTGVAFGLAPALKATRVDLVPALRGESANRSAGRRRLTLKNVLVTFQVAVSVVLLGATSFFVQMLSASETVRSGFAVDGVAFVETDARYAGYSGAVAQTTLEEVRRRIAALPGVQSAAVSNGLPMAEEGEHVVVEGAPVPAGPTDARPFVVAVWGGPHYFETMRIPLVAGRALDDRDRPDTPRAAVISETMARQYFGGRAPDAIGRRFRLERDTGPAAWIEVVGVARDTRTSLVDPHPQLFYRSPAQWDVLPTTVIARTSLDAAALAGVMQRELRAVNPALPVVTVKTMAQHLDESMALPKAMAAFLGGLGLLGACLAGLGLYAVVAFAVSRQSREIGIRMALGARSAQVVRAVARDVALLIGIGTGAGIALTVLTVVGLGAVSVATPGVTLYRPTPDPIAFVTIAAGMAVVGLAAAFVPARRAARLDPLLALRRD